MNSLSFSKLNLVILNLLSDHQTVFLQINTVKYNVDREITNIYDNLQIVRSHFFTDIVLFVNIRSTSNIYWFIGIHKWITIRSLSNIHNNRSCIRWAKPKVIFNYSMLPTNNYCHFTNCAVPFAKKSVTFWKKKANLILQDKLQLKWRHNPSTNQHSVVMLSACMASVAAPLKHHRWRTWLTSPSSRSTSSSSYLNRCSGGEKLFFGFFVLDGLSFSSFSFSSARSFSISSAVGANTRIILQSHHWRSMFWNVTLSP